MLSCLKASEQISQGLDRPLKPMEKIQLKLHLMMCKHCARCSDQLELLHRVTAQRQSETD